MCYSILVDRLFAFDLTFHPDAPLLRSEWEGGVCPSALFLFRKGDISPPYEKLKVTRMYIYIDRRSAFLNVICAVSTELTVILINANGIEI